MSDSKHLPLQFITLEALYHAYRKAKVDVFSERSQPMAVAFCTYERDLHSNLKRLRATLTQESPSWPTSPEFIGEHGFIPKSLSISPVPHGASDRPHFMPSNPDDIWKIQKARHQGGNEHQVEFRPVARFSVDMYITCALWVNSVGHLFDACLTRSARGTRVRRIGRRESAGPRPYHITAPGSFKPYFYAYQEWREHGLRAIKHELEQRRRVVAITMDLKSFYHNVDPSFLLEPIFLNKIDFEARNQRSLSHEETLFTSQLITSLQTWAVPFTDPNGPSGIPVGPSAPRIIANVLLAYFDRQIEQKLEPVYYGRYVDDIFLVLNDGNRFPDSDSVIAHLITRLDPMLAREGDFGHDLVLKLPYGTGSKLIFQSKKQRIFPLADEVGQDLIRTIEAKIDEVSSEWRLLPDLDGWDSSPAAKILSASTNTTESIDSIRKADDLTLKRMSFSVMLRHHDILARDLPANEWKDERREFLRFAERHVLTPLRIFDYNDYLPRLLALAVSCHDWKAATQIVERIKYSTHELRATLETAKSSQEWAGYFRHLTLALVEATLRSFPLRGAASTNLSAGRLILNKIAEISPDHESIKSLLPEDPAKFSCELFSADLGQVPFKEWLFELADLQIEPHPLNLMDLPEDQRLRATKIVSFIRRPDAGLPEEEVQPDVPLAPFIFATRPISVREITEYDKDAVEDLAHLRMLVEALRGTWVGNVEPPVFPKPQDVNFSIGSVTRRRNVRVAITSFLVEESSWARAADGRPDLSVKRYKRLARLANAIVKARPRPRYVVFPELSIPRQWLRGLTNLFIRSGISVIAGVEYGHKNVPPMKGQPQQVLNEAYLALTDTRLGYPSSCVIRQLKTLPAHGERDNLRGGFNAVFPPASDDQDNGKPIYRHFGHGFGVLICSELTDVKFRAHFRGKIDTLFVLSWNQDLESFSSLVDSTALDIHCYLALINNRKYGDSRVRVPAKKHWARDLVRIKGGLDDYFVVTDLDIMALRNFQSFHEPPLGDAVDFKPTPEGFRIVGWRRRTPGGGF